MIRKMQLQYTITSNKYFESIDLVFFELLFKVICEVTNFIKITSKGHKKYQLHLLFHHTVEGADTFLPEVDFNKWK